MDVVVLGHIIIETVVFPDGSVLTPVLGSPAAYSSVAMARLGNHVGLCTKVGKDIPKEFIEVFDRAGVDLTGMRIVGRKSTRNKLIYTTPESKRVEYLNKAPDIEFYDIPDTFKEASLFYICPMDYEVPPRVVERLADEGKEVVVDLGGYGGATSATHPYGAKSKLSVTTEIISMCGITKASIEDCRYIFGETRTSEPERRYADKMLTMGAKRVVITLGSKGVYYTDMDVNKRFPPLACKAIDPTGAGDAFAAGMIHGYLWDKGDIDTMIMFGQATACCVVERTGGVIPERMPSKEEVQQKLRKEVVNGRD